MRAHTDVEQGSLQWMLLRCGKVTASEMDSLVTPLGKVKTGDGPRTYLFQKLAEAWTGQPLPQVQGVFDLEQGQILEEYAKPAFMVETGLDVRNVAFIETDDGRCGCSPDGMVGENWGVEIKCPRIDTHIRYLIDGKLPTDYIAQVQGSMFVTGAGKWMFYSFRRKMPPLILTVERDDDYQKAISEALETFTAAFDKGMARLEEINGGPPQRKQYKFSKPETEDELEGITP
jgi:hypothetical protein